MEVMDKASYTEGLALSILPEGHKYSFHSIEVISELDENGELQIDIDGRVDVGNMDGVKMFLEEFYTSSGSTFNIKSGRADRKGKDAELRGYRKCIMQVQQKKESQPRMKGLHQDCRADLNFKLDHPKVEYNIYYERKKLY